MSLNEPEVEVAIARDDWERFLESIERLMSLHQQTIKRLKELRRRNEALRKELRDAMGLRSVQVDGSGGRVSAVEARPGFVERLFGTRQTTPSPVKQIPSETIPEQPAPAPVATSLTTCNKCGYQLTKPSRFCESCGASFGALICRCGRELTPRDKFCDSCGQKVFG